MFESYARTDSGTRMRSKWILFIIYCSSRCCPGLDTAYYLLFIAHRVVVRVPTLHTSGSISSLLHGVPAVFPEQFSMNSCALRIPNAY